MEIPQISQSSLFHLATPEGIIASLVISYFQKIKSIYQKAVEQVHLHLFSSKESKMITCPTKTINYDEIERLIRTIKCAEDTFSCEAAVSNSPLFHVNGMTIKEGREVNPYEIECLGYSQDMQTRFFQRAVPSAKVREVELLNSLFKRHLERIWNSSFNQLIGKRIGFSLETFDGSRFLKCKFIRVGNDQECMQTCSDIFSRFFSECCLDEFHSFTIQIACINNAGSYWDLYKYRFYLTPMTYCERLTSHRINGTLAPVTEKFDHFLQKREKDS